MAESRKLITDFIGGEVSDRIMARIDRAIYDRTCRTVENLIVHATGGLDMAPGTVFICEAKTNTGAVRLLPFEKSSSEKYVLELSELACRFYRDRAQILDGANPLEIVTPWLGVDLFGLQFAQQEHKLYLAHGNYPLNRLGCHGDTAWSQADEHVDANLAVAHTTTPFVSNYSYADDVFTKRTNPDVLPTGNALCCSVSEDGVYLAVGHYTSPYISIYKRDGDTYKKLANPVSLPTIQVDGCSFSTSSMYLAVASGEATSLRIYKRSGDTFTKLDDPVMPSGNAQRCAFSYDDIYLAVPCMSTPYITVYKRSGDTFTKVDPLPALTAIGRGVGWSKDGTYLSVGQAGAPYLNIYKRSGDTFAKLTPPATAPTGDGMGVVFSRDGNYLTVAHTTTPFVTIYKRKGDTFTKLTNPLTLPASNGRGCSFSADGVYLAVAHDLTPFVTIYKRAGDVFTKLTNPVTLPTGAGFGVMFIPDAWQGVSWGSKYPKALTFHDQRLVLGRDGIIRGSRTGWPQDFELDAADNSAGFEYSLASDLLEEIIWLKTKDHRIVAGTSHGEWLLSGGDSPISGSNIYADRVSAHGSAEISAILANESLLFVQKGGQLLREFMYSMERGGYISPDLTFLADHIGEKGLLEFAWQRSPRSLLWVRLGGDELAALTLDRNNNIVAWSRQPKDGLVKSMAVVSGDATNAEDTVYLCVQRVINGVTKQYIEYMKPINPPADADDDFFVECGKTFDYSATTDTMEGATKANPVVVSATGHPFVNDEFVRITGVVGMTQLNGNTYMVKNKAAGTFELYLTDGVTPLNGLAFGTYVSGGLCEKVVKVLSGLDHLKGKTVAVYADGEALATEVVDVGTGAITIDEYAAKIHVGLPYTGTLWTQRLGRFDPVRIPEATLLLKDTRGGKIGPDVAGLKAIRYDSTTALTGPQEVRIGGRFSTEGNIMIVQDQPLRMSILGIVGKMSIGE